MSPDFAQTLGNDVERTGENNCWTSPDGPQKRYLRQPIAQKKILWERNPRVKLDAMPCWVRKLFLGGWYHLQNITSTSTKWSTKKHLFLWVHSRSMSFSHFCQNPKKSPKKIAGLDSCLASNPTVSYQPAGTSRCFTPVEVISFNTVLHALRHAWLRSILLLSEMEDFTVRHKRREGGWGILFLWKEMHVVYIYLSIYLYLQIYTVYTHDSNI